MGGEAHHTRIKKKKIFSICARKAFEKIYLKNFSKLEIDQCDISLTLRVYKIPMANIILNSKILKLYLLRSGT